jgi:hypothetical protein
VHAQQVCDATSQAHSSPSARFVGDRDEGVVTDQPTQLMWARCAIGQTWRGDACTGSPTRHAWSAAQALAQEANRAGTLFYNDWRLPTLRELATVAERQCAHPRINLAVFPDTPSAMFWTSSSSVRAAEDAYVLDFSSGGVAHDVKTAQHHVRLVRDAP